MNEDHSSAAAPPSPAAPPGAGGAPGSEAAFGIADHIIFLPEAHLRLLSLQWQLERFEAYHTTFWTRLSHGVSFFPVVWGLIALASHFPQQTAPLFPDWPLLTQMHMGAILCTILAVWYVAVEPVAGLICAVILTLFGISANLFNAALGDWAVPVTILGVIAPAVAFLAVSHAAEPIPPPWTGSRRMMAWDEWMRTAPFWRKVGFFTVGAVMGHVWEFWAAMRFMPLVVLWQLHDRFGYRKALFAAARARAPQLRQAMTGFIRDMDLLPK